MSGATSLDIRLPIGGLFAVLGVMLTGYGLATVDAPSRYARSLMVNVNLWWGMVMLAFGLGLLLSATFYRGRSTVRSASQTPEGRRTETGERERGLER
jgi:membrane protein implicated in regulation of membrane protease activity